MNESFIMMLCMRYIVILFLLFSNGLAHALPDRDYFYNECYRAVGLDLSYEEPPSPLQADNFLLDEDAEMSEDYIKKRVLCVRAFEFILKQYEKSVKKDEYHLWR